MPSVAANAADKPKYATDMPAGITAPAEVKTRIGTLRTKEGFPDSATVEKVYDCSGSEQFGQVRPVK
jgi:hypothetical protein